MQDSKKTKAQLIAELAELKNRLAELTGKPSDETTKTTETTNSHPRSTRNEIETTIQLIGDFGLVEAKGLDLSDGGIGFELEDDIPFDMEFEVDISIALIWCGCNDSITGAAVLASNLSPLQPPPCSGYTRSWTAIRNNRHYSTAAPIAVIRSNATA